MSVSSIKKDQQDNINQSVITNLSHDGRGVISVNGKKVLIDGVLPNEEVAWSYIKRHRRFDEAKVTEVISASPDRVPAICPNFLTCGGCSYQHIAIDKQLVHKQEIVAELLEHVGGQIKPKEWLAPLQAETQGYRTKARLGIRFVRKKEKLLIGFREKASNFITDMDTCKVLHPSLDNLLKPLASLISQLSIYEQVPQVEMAMGESESNNVLGSNIALIIRHLAEFTDNDKQLLLDFAQKYNINLLLQPKGPDTVHAIYGTDKLFYKVKLSDNQYINFEFHPQNFTQVNLAMNQLMLNQALNLLELKGHEKVLDLFCGLGNFTLPIATHLESKGGSVLGIEGCDNMVARAQNNAEANNVSNTAFTCLDLYNEENLEKNNGPLNQHYDCVVLDPPRSGAKQVLPYLAKNNIQKILYISCDPATFARDVGILCNDYGYKLQKVGIMDMFPHTKHVESMGLLIK